MTDKLQVELSEAHYWVLINAVAHLNAELESGVNDGDLEAIEMAATLNQATRLLNKAHRQSKGETP